MIASIFFISYGNAATYCFGKGASNQSCYPDLSFDISIQTKAVNRAHLKSQQPSVGKRWPKVTLGTETINNFCNSNNSSTGKICFSRTGLESVLPRLDIVDRGADSSATNFPITLRISGIAKYYWYYPQGWTPDGNNFLSGQSTHPLLLQCPCQYRAMYQLGGFVGPYTECGFGSASTLTFQKRNENRTTDPNDCYVDVQNESNSSEHSYYIVKKIPYFFLEEIVHANQTASRNYEAAVAAEATAKQRYIAANGTSIVNPIAVWYRVYLRYDWGKETIREVSTNIDAIRNEERWKSDGLIGNCPCQNSGCTVGSAIPWNKTYCYESYSAPLKSPTDSAAEQVAKSAAAVTAKQNWDAAILALNSAAQTLLSNNEGAKTAKAQGVYFPYKVYEPGVDPERNANDFILTYNNSLLPNAHQAIPVYGSQFQANYPGGACAINSYIQDVHLGSGYTDYILTAQGNPKNKTSDIKVSLAQRALQSIAVVTDIAINGAECRLTMISPYFNNSHFVYYYSTGDVEMPPVRILSFDVSVGGKKASLGECSVDHTSPCLSKEALPTDVGEFPATDGRTPLRSKRTDQASATLSVDTEQVTVPAKLAWSVVGAADDQYAVAISRIAPGLDRNSREYDKPFSGGNGSYTFDSGDVLQVPHGLTDCSVDSIGQEHCRANTYSFFLTATNNRAVTDSDRLKYSEYPESAVQYVWAVAEKIDVVVKKKEHDLAKESKECFEKGLNTAQSQADGNVVGQLACSGLGSATSLGIKALFAVATGGASATEEAAAVATGTLSPTAILTNAVGGLVGGGCKTAILLTEVSKHTDGCKDIWNDPNSNPSGAFWTGFGKGFFPGLFQGFLSSLFGNLFTKVSCIPVLDGIIKGIIQFAAGTLGSFLGDLIGNIFHFNANSVQPQDKAMLVVGGGLGGTVGGTIGTVVEEALGLGAKVKPFVNGLAQVLGAAPGTDITNVSCPTPPTEGTGQSTPPPTYYLCQPNLGQCIVSPGSPSVPTPHTTPDSCAAACPKPPASPTQVPLPAPSPSAPKPKTIVGCGCPLDVGNLSDPVTYRTNAKRAVADALMTTAFVVSNGDTCIARKYAYNCANILYLNNKSIFDSILGISKNNGGDLTQQKVSIDRSIFDGMWTNMGAALGCAYTILPNLYSCTLESAQIQCNENTLVETDCLDPKD